MHRKLAGTVNMGNLAIYAPRNIRLRDIIGYEYCRGMTLKLRFIGFDEMGIFRDELRVSLGEFLASC